MGKKLVGVAVSMSVAALGLAGCSSSASKPSTGSTGGKQPFVGVILPDSKSSVRWETSDRPALEAAFKAKGVKYDIQNAQGDKTAFQTIGDQMINEGVNVLVIVDLDAGSGTAVLTKAKAAGIKTIDYDRLTLGGGADYYVSFDNVHVGELQGQGLVQCLSAAGASKPVVAEVNGSPTDNNAKLFAQGYDSVLNPKYADGTFVKGPNQSTDGWDNAKAGTNFEQMLIAAPNIGGVLVANDGMAQSVIAILKKNHLNGKVPVTGQDATVQGLQSVLAGDQCMTVFKDSNKEAPAAARLAIDLATGNTADAASYATQKVNDPNLGKDVPSVLLTPVAITKTNVQDVIAAGAAKVEDICTADFAAACTAAGVK